MVEDKKESEKKSSVKELPGDHIVSCANGVTLYCPVRDKKLEIDIASALEICPMCNKVIYRRK